MDRIISFFKNAISMTNEQLLMLFGGIFLTGFLVGTAVGIKLFLK